MICTLLELFHRRQKVAKILTEEAEALAQRGLRDSMHESVSAQYNRIFDESPFLHLPDIVVTGKKKCGTKALLTFLLEHPKIKGCREEFKWFRTGNYSYDMKALLGHASNKQKYIEWEPHKGQVLLVKMGNAAVWNITSHAALVTADINMTVFDVHKWRQHVVAIDCLCDPVKRLFSDYLHVKDAHNTHKKRPNSQFLGEDSKLYPFSGMTFADVVAKYLPNLSQMTDKNPIKHMFQMGLYSNILEMEKKFYGDRLIVTDGGVFASQPWVTLAKIEKVLFPNRFNKNMVFFHRKRFHQRPDGYYCLIKVKQKL